jgi:hypothetical protein
MSSDDGSDSKRGRAGNDRSSETREGYVPSGRRGWLKVGGQRRGVEVQPVTPNWSRALREQRAEQAKQAGPSEQKKAWERKTNE